MRDVNLGSISSMCRFIQRSRKVFFGFNEQLELELVLVTGVEMIPEWELEVGEAQLELFSILTCSKQLLFLAAEIAAAAAAAIDWCCSK